MKAERTKRALILEAEGDKQAAITRAEGSKQAAILDAEGRAKAIKEVAEAEKFQRIALAEGEARGIENVFNAIHAGNPTDELLAVRYIDALPKIADGKATKLFMPYEMSAVLSSVAGMAEAFKSGTDASATETPAIAPGV
jgi:regulator of protease activity HflC (stomatin/prohibitin superfamily)